MFGDVDFTGRNAEARREDLRFDRPAKGPFARPVFEQMALREWTFGWTIEPQILAARLGIPTCEIDVAEHPRIAGAQKVSQVNWGRTLRIGGEILAAGWRTRFRPLPQPCPTPRPRPIPI